MPSTKIRGNTQIIDYTIDIGRLEQDFLDGSDWNITNGNQDAGIRGVRLVPLNDDELASKYYVDSTRLGLDWKDSCQITTSTGLSNYNASGGTAGTGAFTGIDFDSSPPFDYGTHSVAVGDRVLIKDQADDKENGIYVVTSTGATGGLERATDQDGTPGGQFSGEVSGGNATFVESGDTYAKTGWVLQGDGDLTLNTDDLIWVQFSGSGTYIAGAGLSLTGNTFSVNVDDDTIEISGDTLQVKADGIDETHLDWGSGADQVDATSVPLDSGGTYGGSATNVQDALEELEGSIPTVDYPNDFGTVAVPSGSNAVSDQQGDTLTLQSSTGTIEIYGLANDTIDFDVADDSINENHIDFGSGADQVDATSIPLDSGGTWSGSATNVQDALEELEGASAKWTTFVTPYGTNPVADEASDTLTFQSSTGTIKITGYDDPEIIDIDIEDDGIKDNHIDWGTGVGQVSGADLPLDTGNFDGILSGSDTDVQTALETLDDHDHSGTYAENAFVTIVPITGTNVVADSTADTLTLTSSTGTIEIVGTEGTDTLDFDIADDSITELHLDLGSGANQIDATTIPIDSGGTYGGSATNVQDALEELEGDIAAHYAFQTISTPSGTSPVADATDDTLTFATDGPITITGDSGSDTVTFDIGDDGIKDNHIDFGTSTGQVSGVDIPLADAGNYFTTDEVESALQELAAATPGFGVTRVFEETPVISHLNPNVTLANTPTAGTLRVYLNGLRQEDPADYSLSGATVTFTSNLLTTPGQSDVVIVDYEY